MLRGYFKSGGSEGHTNYLARKGLINYIQGEFNMFKKILQHPIAGAGESTFGNSFGQVLHDGGTIFDKRKRLVFVIQFIESKWENNHALCLKITPLRSESADPTAKVLHIFFVSAWVLSLKMQLPRRDKI